MEVYADFEFYRDQYRGSVVPEAAFPSSVLKASAYLKRITFGRIREPYPDEVCCAVCELTEMQYHFDQQEQTGGREIKSENNDGFAVTFVTETADGQSKKSALHRKMYAAAKVWLGNTDLLYQGVAE